MKKSLLIIAATSLVVACMENDFVNETAETPIGFETYSGLALKSSSALTLETYHQTFGVWGYKTVGTESTVMDHYKVIYNDANGNGSHDWDYDGDNAPSGQYLKYWDKTASQYRFDAYAPYNNTNASITNHVISIESGEYAANENLQATLSETLNTDVFSGVGATSTTASTDWMTASVTRNASGNPATMSSELVTLSFSHLLTKVIVAVKTKVDFPKTINISSLSINNVYGTGSYNGTAWTASGTAKSVAGVVGSIQDAEKTDNANTHNYYAIECLVMPQATAAPTFSVTYTIGDDPEEFVVTGKSISNITSFAAGTVYTITATIGPDPIHFDCTLTQDWTADNTGSVTVE